MKKIILIFILVLFSGCATKIIWDKPGATQVDFNTDEYDCRYKAKTVGYMANRGPHDWLWAAMQEKDEYIRCMESKGYAQRK